jgi:hypothetical protein
LFACQRKVLYLFDISRGGEFALTGEESLSFDCFGVWQPSNENDGGLAFVEMAIPLDCLRCSVNGVVRVVEAEKCRYYLQEIVYDVPHLPSGNYRR